MTPENHNSLPFRHESAKIAKDLHMFLPFSKGHVLEDLLYAAAPRAPVLELRLDG
jgi:hypothetical protein